MERQMTIIRTKPHIPVNWQENKENRNSNSLKIAVLVLICSVAIVVASLYSINKLVFKSSEKAETFASNVPPKTPQDAEDTRANDTGYIQPSVSPEKRKAKNEDRQRQPEQTILQNVARHLDNQTEDLRQEQKEAKENAREVGERRLTVSKEEAIKMEKEGRLIW
jgi:hypothetical protein